MILTTCKYFDLVGNRCSRVTDGKCNDLQDCEFKYIAELKAENAKLKSCLQEINAIAEQLLEKGLEPQSVEHQLRLKGKRELASIISDLITKAESEG